MPIENLKHRLLRSPRMTLAVAESLTCGQVQSRIGAVSGASHFFLGGITAYTIEQKVRFLGIDRAGAEAVDCVSAEVAQQMARGVCLLFGADIGVATTGYAEASVERRVSAPFAFWAVALRDASGSGFTVRHGRVECPTATRVQAQAMVADTAVAQLAAWVAEVRP